MKGFTKRERRIISYAYNDAARICWERESESNRYKNKDKQHMAGHLKALMQLRARMILKYGCGLPRTRKLKEI